MFLSRSCLESSKAPRGCVGAMAVVCMRSPSPHSANFCCAHGNAGQSDDLREQDKEDMAHKLQSTSKSLDDCQRRLEAAGINAVSLKDWIAREGDQDEDMVMLENQLSDAMGLLKGHKVRFRDKILHLAR